MAESLAPEVIASILGGYNGDPFAVLGPHLTTLDASPAVAVRVFLPWAEHVQVVLAAEFRDGDTLHDMQLIHPEGLFEAIISSEGIFGYTLRATNRLGRSTDLLDPYSFGPVLTDFDLHLIEAWS